MRPQRSGIEYFARIAACAALLTTSFFGQWLHHLAFHNENEQGINSACSAQPHSHSCGHSHSKHALTNEGPRSEDQKSPAAPHDHNSCGICYVIAQAASDPVTVMAPTSVEPLFELHVTASEFASHAECCTPIARGPPAA